MIYKYDYIILGGGIGGIHLAKSIDRNKKVLLIEREKLGGTSLRLGAVPVKRLLDIFKNEKDRNLVRKNIEDTWQNDLYNLEKIIEKKIDRKNIDIIYGQGNFINKNTIEVNGVSYEADKIVIATGTSPKSTDKIKIDGKYILSHKEVLEEIIVDKDIVIYGGNVEGMEIANLLQLLGNRVIVIEAENQILHGKDRDLIKPIEKEFKNIGGKIILQERVIETEIKDFKLYSKLSNGEILSSDLGVLTFYREGNIPKGIENTNIFVEKGFIKVDDTLQTSEKNIYAIGDINGIHGMAHIAMDQARILAINFNENIMENYSYENVPGAFFTSPEYVGVGKTEMDLKTEEYLVGICSLQDNYRGWAKSYKDGFTKVIISKDGKILGIHLVGENVSEVLGFISIFIGKDYNEVLKTLVVHPSLSETIKEAIENGVYGE